MRVYCLFAFVLIALANLNCGKDDSGNINPDNIQEELPQGEEEQAQNENIYFSAEVDFSIFFAEWIVIHDLQGELIDFRAIDQSASRTIEMIEPDGATIPERFNVTFIGGRNQGEDFLIYDLRTYRNIRRGSVWLEENSPSPVTNGQSFALKIEDVPELLNYNIFTSVGIVPFGGLQSDISEIGGARTLSIRNIPLYEGEEYLLNLNTFDGEVKQSPIQPADGTVLSLNYSSFQDYDFYLDEIVPADGDFFLYTSGYSEENPNYYTRSLFDDFGMSLITDANFQNNRARAGYLSKFNRYRTRFFISLDDYDYEFISKGDALDDFSVLEKPTLSILNSNPFDFEFETSENVVRSRAQWRFRGENETLGRISTTWIISSDNAKEFAIGDFPEEILNEYPFLNLDNLSLFNLQLTTEGSSHDEFIQTSKVTFEDNRERVERSFTIKF